MANVSKLLYTTTGPVCFLDELQLDDSDHALLRDARRKIRQHLRSMFAAASRERLGKLVTPRFFTQGSYSYKTINDPAHVPPQQMDLDDGCYLPMTFVKGAKPSQAASLFFELVDGTLKELATKEGWQFAKKATCARVIVNERAHVDVPLYAIPDSQFRMLEEAAALNGSSFAADSALKKRASVDRWDALPSDCVLLAHREDGWISSDPRKIADWFSDAIEVHGEILRRVCRYLKAWRDHHTPDLDPLSSIILMVCAWNVFEDMGRPNVPRRDDLALLAVIERLPRLLAGTIKNPSEPEEKLCRRLDDDARQMAIQKANEFAVRLGETIEKCVDPAQAVNTLITLLGERVPYAPELVSVAEAAHAEVRKHPAKQVAAPTVGRSISG